MPVQTIRIIIIISSLGKGGAEAMLVKLLQRIDRQHFHITVVSLTDRGVNASLIERLGIEVVALNMSLGMLIPLKFYMLVKFLRRNKPHIVHCWMYHADLLGGLASKCAGVRSIIWGIRHSDLTPEKNKKSTLMVVSICARLSKWVPNYILSCSKKAEAVHIAKGYHSEKMIFIPNGFDLDDFSPNLENCLSVRREINLPENCKLVGIIGRYHPQKNQIGFLDAAARIVRHMPNVQFLLVGKDNVQQNEELFGKIRDLKLHNHFHLLGMREDVSRIMSALDLLVLPSYGEGFPNVVGEAMATAVPCVVTKAGDAAEIVGETGAVVDLGDMDALADQAIAILSLSKKEWTRMGFAARASIKAYYDIKHVVKEYEVLYTKARNETAPSLLRDQS